MPCATTLRAVPSTTSDAVFGHTTPMRPMGYGGVGSSPALPLLPDTPGIASSRRLGSAGHPPQVSPALATRPARVLQRPPSC